MKEEKETLRKAFNLVELSEAISNASTELLNIRDSLTNCDTANLNEETIQKYKEITASCDSALNGIFNALGVTEDFFRNIAKENREKYYE